MQPPPKYSKYLVDKNSCIIQTHVRDISYKMSLSNIQTGHLRKFFDFAALNVCVSGVYFIMAIWP